MATVPVDDDVEESSNGGPPPRRDSIPKPPTRKSEGHAPTSAVTQTVNGGRGTAIDPQSFPTTEDGLKEFLNEIDGDCPFDDKDTTHQQTTAEYKAKAVVVAAASLERVVHSCRTRAVPT